MPDGGLDSAGHSPAAPRLRLSHRASVCVRCDVVMAASPRRVGLRDWAAWCVQIRALEGASRSFAESSRLGAIDRRASALRNYNTTPPAPLRDARPVALLFPVHLPILSHSEVDFPLSEIVPGSARNVCVFQMPKFSEDICYFSEEDKFHLIDLVQERKVLWLEDHCDYKNSAVRTRKWHEIQQSFVQQGKQVPSKACLY